MQAGSRIGEFELLEVIGRGGMGEVWRAHDTRLERDVALKTLPPQFAADASRSTRLRREARLMATLNHPNIAAILGLEEQDGHSWLVLELVEGLTLEERLAEGPLTLDEAIGIALQVSDALRAAHGRGIIHCDLKPSNIKILPDGQIKVLDFGIARNQPLPSQGQTTLTAAGVPGEIAGTPACMSPEQLRGAEVGPTSDIWAFGVLLYRMLAGVEPFAGTTFADTAAKVLHTEPEMAVIRARAPESLVRLLNRCLEKEPRRRIQHAADLRILIEEAQASGRPSVAVKRRRRALVAAGISAAVLLAAGLLWHFRDGLSSGSAGTQAARPAASIAVLPFVNLSADPEQEYFSDGLSEELINQLAHIEGLRVTARTSAFSFKDKAQDLRSVARQLGVMHVLEGSVRKAGGRVRITAKLVDPQTGFQVWSETYDRAMDDAFAIQDEIATAVARRLGPALGATPASTQFGGTRSFEAYDHLLRGVAKFGSGTREGQDAAIQEYSTALAIDPGYARASAEFAIALNSLGPPSADPAARNRRIEEAVARAQKNGPDEPLTNVARMWMHSDRHEWIEADNACKAVFAANSDPRANLICAGFLTLTGRARKALPYREVGRLADPLSMVFATTVVRQYALLDRGPEIEREYARLTGMTGRRWLADEAMLAYLANKHAPPDEMRAVLTRACPAPMSVECRAWTAAVLTPDLAAGQLRQQLPGIASSPAPQVAGSIALAAAYVGDTALALDALAVLTTKASSPAFQGLWFPLLGKARQDSRFKRLMQDLGFVDLWRRTGDWTDFCHPTGASDFECT